MDFFMLYLNNFLFLSLNFFFLLFFFNFFLLFDFLLLFFYFLLFFFSLLTCFSFSTFLSFLFFSFIYLLFSSNNNFVYFNWLFVLSGSSDCINFSWFSFSNSCFSFSMSSLFISYDLFGLFIYILDDLISNILFNIKFLFSLFLFNFFSNKSQFSISKISFMGNSFVFTNCSVLMSLSFGQSFLMMSNLLNGKSGFISSSMSFLLSFLKNFLLVCLTLMISFSSLSRLSFC